MRHKTILLLVMWLVIPSVFAAPPLISSVSVNLHSSYAEIVWRTDLPADSRVDYGVNGFETYRFKSTYTTNHRVLLANLDAGSEYQYKITSCRNGECASTEPQGFKFVKPDTVPPKLFVHPLENFTFEGSVDVEGSVNEPCRIYISLNGNQTGNFTQNGSFSLTLSVNEGVNVFEFRAIDMSGNEAMKSFKVNADPNPTQIIETNIDQLDLSSSLQQTLEGIVSKPYVNITVTVEGYNFTTTADNEGHFSVDISLEGPTTGQEKLNSVVIWARDQYGRSDLLMNGSITFIKCGQGSGYSTRFYDVTPEVIIPEHIMNGMAQIGFRVDFKYTGAGSNAYMVMDPMLTVQDRMSEQKRNRVDEELFAGAVTQCSEDRSSCYFIVNLAPEGKEELRNKTSIRLPLMLRLQYSQGVGGATATELQDICIDMGFMLDKKLLDFYKPNRMLNRSIRLINSTMGALSGVEKPIQAMKSAAIAGCFGASLWDFTNRIMMSLSCTEGNADASMALAQGEKTCPQGANEGCQSCLDSKWRVHTSEWYRNLVCDRLFCPSVPTLARHEKTYYDSITGQKSACSGGYASEACQKEFRFAWDTVSLLDEYSEARKQAGLSVRGGKSLFGELDNVIRQSNQFCPAVKGFPSQIIKVGDKEYFISKDKRIYEVWKTMPAEMQGSKIVPVSDGIPEGYQWRGPLDPSKDYIPPSILSLIKEDNKTSKEYVFDPTAGPYNALVGGCLPAMSGYLHQWQQMLGAVQQCLEMVQVKGEGTPGVCKAVLSYYVCDMIWDTARCFGAGLTAGSQAGRFDSGLLGTLSKVANASSQVAKSVTNRYGETGMFDVMFNQRKLLHGACIAFFTGDMSSFDLNTMFSAEVGMPVLGSEGLVAPATRRYLGSNPFQNGWATFIYHTAYALSSGAELKWQLKLVCGNDMQCPEFGGKCDCFERGEPIERVIASNTMPAGEFATDEYYVKLTEPVRFDRAVLEWTWRDNKGITQKAEVVKKIKQVGATAPAYCSYAPEFSEYRCPIILPKDGLAFFIGTPVPKLPPGMAQVFKPGDRFGFSGAIGVQQRKDSAVPKFLSIEVYAEEPWLHRVSNHTVMLANSGSFKLEDFPSLWPIVRQEEFNDMNGVSRCDQFDLNHPARWQVLMTIYKGEQAKDGTWKPSSEVALYEGKPQQLSIEAYVACSGEAREHPVCTDGAISRNSEPCMCGGKLFEPSESGGLFCCNGVVADKPCDEARPKFKGVVVKQYYLEPGENSLSSRPRELSELEQNEVFLTPVAKKGLNFTTISVQDSSNVELYLLEFNGQDTIKHLVYPMGQADKIGAWVWQDYDMAGFTEHPFKIQFMARDEHGLKGYFPGSPVSVVIKESELPAR